MTGTTDPLRARITADDVDGTLTAVDDGWVLTMSRELAHPVDRVWRKLTEPAELGTWSPVVPDRPLTSAGPATTREAPGQPAVDAEVLLCDPPRELVHRWGPQLLRWTLTPTAAGSRLTLEHTFPERAEAGMYGAGWHLCLAVLGATLDGHPVERVVGARATEFGWAELRERYEAALR